MKTDTPITLNESTETLPPSDPRDAAVKELDSLCRELVQTVHAIQAEERAGNQRQIGRLEERIFTMVDRIHSQQRDLYLNRGINVVISHTAEGLPIRVNKVSKLNLWGSFGG